MSVMDLLADSRSIAHEIAVELISRGLLSLDTNRAEADDPTAPPCLINHPTGPPLTTDADPVSVHLRDQADNEVPRLQEFRTEANVEIMVRAKTDRLAQGMARLIKKEIDGLGAYRADAAIGNGLEVGFVHAVGPKPHLFSNLPPLVEAEFIYIVDVAVDVRTSLI